MVVRLYIFRNFVFIMIFGNDLFDLLDPEHLVQHLPFFPFFKIVSKNAQIDVLVKISKLHPLNCIFYIVFDIFFHNLFLILVLSSISDHIDQPVCWNTLFLNILVISCLFGLKTSKYAYHLLLHPLIYLINVQSLILVHCMSIHNRIENALVIVQWVHDLHTVEISQSVLQTGHQHIVDFEVSEIWV